MAIRLASALVGFCLALGAFGSPYFPFDENGAWTYATGEGAQVSAMKPEKPHGNVWKQELRRTDDELLEASWFTDDDDGAFLNRTMRFDSQATVTIEFSEPILYLPDNFPKRRKWAGRAPNSTILVELNLVGTPVKALARMNYTYQCAVGERERVGRWEAMPVTETAVLEIESVEPETESPQLDAMLRQLLAQPGWLPYRAGSVLKYTATRWFASGIGEVKSDENAVDANGKRQQRVRTLTGVERAPRQ